MVAHKTKTKQHFNDKHGDQFTVNGKIEETNKPSLLPIPFQGQLQL